MKRALVTGISGMDGSHLADLLLDMGYQVHGLVRPSSRPVTDRIEHLLDRIELCEGDMLDQASLDRVVRDCRPDEVYNLAAQSYVGASWNQPLLTAEVTALGTLRLLTAVRNHASSDVRFYQASSSEQFGSSPAPQDETTSFAPRSPYGVAKAFAHHTAVNHRESYGMHVSCGILFNHESERRGRESVTRRISRGVAEIAKGQRDVITLGNLDARRDWGYAPDYVRAMWLMLQQGRPDDYVVATGESHSVAEFARAAFAVVGYAGSWQRFVRQDEQLVRPADVGELRGDATKARLTLGWKPTIPFEEWVARMVEYDLEAVGEAVAV